MRGDSHEPRVDQGVAVAAQHPVEVAGQAAAGDVGDGVHLDRVQQRPGWPGA